MPFISTRIFSRFSKTKFVPMYTNCTLSAHKIIKMKRGEAIGLSLERTALAVFQPQTNPNVLENNAEGYLSLNRALRRVTQSAYQLMHTHNFILQLF